MIEEAITTMKEADSFAAVEFLGCQSEALEVVDVYNKLLKHFYYEEKNVQAVVALGRAGIQYGLSAAIQTDDQALANVLKERSRAVSYNLASYTWPGWNDPGITIGEGEMVHGLDAAKATLRLATELDMPPLKLSRCHWMLGAQEMAAGNWGQAQGHFKAAVEMADAAGSQVDKLLSAGFGAMTSLLIFPDDHDALANFEESKTKLAELEDGEFFVQQLDTASEVFSN